MQPSYEELVAEIRFLRERIAKLEEQLRLNSKNSSKPPSTDKKGSSQPHKKGGAKPGHPGHFRPLFSAEQVDKKVALKSQAPRLVHFAE